MLRSMSSEARVLQGGGIAARLSEGERYRSALGSNNSYEGNMEKDISLCK